MHNIFNKIIFYYFSILTLTLFLVFVYSAYTNLSINIFLYFLLFIIAFSFFIFFCRKFIIFKDKYVLKFLNMNFIYIIQRMLVIKFMLLYIYITSDSVYCSSVGTKALKNTFVDIGNGMGVEATTTVSTLELVGMCTIIVGAAYCGLKFYKSFKPQAKSIQSEYEALIQKSVNINQKNTNLKSEIELERILFNSGNSNFSTLKVCKFEIQVSNLQKDVLLLKNDFADIIFKEYKKQRALVKDVYFLQNYDVECFEFLLRNFYHLSRVEYRADHGLNAHIRNNPEMIDFILEKTYNIEFLSNTLLGLRLVLRNHVNDLGYLGIELLNPISSRLLHGITAEIFCKVVHNSILHLLQGTLTGIAFMDIISLFGLDKKYLNSIYSNPNYFVEYRISAQLEHALSRFVRDIRAQFNLPYYH
jgi:hypothetical protein